MSERTNKGGRHWPWIIAGFLIVNAVASGALIAIAGASGGHAVEPDYYAKAVNWDQEMEQQRVNQRLGWKLVSTLSPTDDGALGVRAVLTDRDGAPVTGATVTLETFHRARANDRLELELTEIDAGVYTAAWSSPRMGLWELRYRARRGDDLFTLRDLGEAVR